MKSCHQPCKNRTTQKTGTDGTHIIPSELFSRAGDTLRVSLGPLPAMENCHSDQILHIFLHNSYTAKMWLRRSRRMSNF
jgi:hypothetical protein